MTVATNMLSENININDEWKLLDNLFNSNGWNKIANDKSVDHITYSKEGNETEFFEIEMDNDTIYVSVPLKNSYFQYKTKFDNYYSAIKYTEEKFHYFVEN